MRILVAVLALLTASACATPALVISRQAEPSAQVEEIRARVFDRHRTELELSLELENPGPALEVIGADFEVLANDVPFASGQLAVSWSVPASGHARQRLPIALAHLDLPRAAADHAKANTVQLVVRGRLLVARAKPIEFDGSTRATPTVALDEDSP